MSSEKIAAMLKWHTIQVKPYLGESSNGEQYGPQEPVPCTVRETIKNVMSSTGDLVVSMANLSALPEYVDRFTPRSEVILPSGRVSYVITSALNVGGSGPVKGLDNVVVYCS
jgi:hypothetical protein